MAILGTQLDQGATFPDMTLNMLGGTTLTIPEELENRWTVLIILRGHW